MNAPKKLAIVDALDQLAMSLRWDDDYSDAYKRWALREAVKQVLREAYMKRAGFAR